MTRPDKRAARFGDRYRIPDGENYLPVGFNIRRFSKAVQDAMPTIRRMTASLRMVAENMRRAREMEDTARQIQAVIQRGVAASAGPHMGGEAWDWGIDDWRAWQASQQGPDILDRIDDTLDSYEDTHDMEGQEFAPSGEEWPYRGF
jgi:hypothetical protein